ncbi:MAG: hypothetical protein QOG71_864 [Pyrinomonadaceae bacterium]|nr:hypothetical protein [Pyrinomonadaceae bacterium]
MSIHAQRVFDQRFLLAVSLVLTMIAFSLALAQPPKADASPKAGTGASACPPQTVEVTYYTDASMTVICGRASLTCYCNSSHWGCQTDYSTERYLDCE